MMNHPFHLHFYSCSVWVVSLCTIQMFLLSFSSVVSEVILTVHRTLCYCLTGKLLYSKFMNCSSEPLIFTNHQISPNSVGSFLRLLFVTFCEAQKCNSFSFYLVMIMIYAICFCYYYWTKCWYYLKFTK